MNQTDPAGVLAATDAPAALLDELQFSFRERPCVDAATWRRPVLEPDLRLVSAGRWPGLLPALVGSPVRAVFAFPLQVGQIRIGVMDLNLSRESPSALGESDLKLARGLADMAAIGLLQERAIHGHRIVADQLQTALNTRIRIEQAKGVLAERYGIDMNEAFTTIRNYARSHNQRLADVTHLILSDTLRRHSSTPPRQSP
ncbi:MAG: GAF and ANTAR domain-containing protein [Kineosporiaceae bacterium]